MRIGDARTSLAAVAAGSADVVVGDAFGARSVPWHLATAEFVADVRRVLRPDGIYVLNVIDYDPLRLLAAEAATVGRPVPARRADDPPGPARARAPAATRCWSASDRPLDLAALAARAAARGEPGSVLDDAGHPAVRRRAPRS